MRKFIYILCMLIPFLTYGQKMAQSSNFEELINEKSSFGEDEVNIVVVEFWAKFNAENDFKDFDKIKGAKYLRVDIASSPDLKKEYRIRMTPTLIVFKDGIKEIVHKAGLDLLCPVTLEQLQDDINELKTASRF